MPCRSSSYNLHPAPEQNFFQVIWGLQHSTIPGTTVDALVRLKELVGTFLYGIPLMSGLAPFCTVGDLPVFAPTNAHTITCGVLNGSWGVGYVVLLVISLVLSLLALRDLWRIHRSQPAAWTLEKRRSVVLHTAQLMLLVAAVITLALYGLSPVAGQRPWSTRYLTSLLIATPAILWPLWRDRSVVTNSFKRLSFWLTGVSNLLRHGLVILIALSFLAGVVMTFRAVPAAAALDQQEYHLVHDLLNIHVTHIYSEYWTCGRIIFQSQEKIICAVVDDHMQVSHNRYEPYAETVVADPHAAYIFPTDPVDAAYVKNCVQRFASSKIHYLHFAFDDYVIFVPG